MSWTRWSRIALCATVLSACGARQARTEYPVLPRNVRESVHRDYRDCRGRDIRGLDLGGGRYRVIACGLDVVYVCPVGPHSRWRACVQETAAAPASQPYVIVMTPGTATAGGAIANAPQASAPTATASTPAPQATAGTAGSDAAPGPSLEQIETGIRQWLDANRASILACTQTQAALIEVGWTAEGIPSIALGGELHGTPGEQCVIRTLANVRFQVAGQAGALRHVIQ